VVGKIAVCDPVVEPAGEDVPGKKDTKPAGPDAALLQKGHLPNGDACQGPINDQQQYVHIFCR